MSYFARGFSYSAKIDASMNDSRVRRDHRGHITNYLRRIVEARRRSNDESSLYSRPPADMACCCFWDYASRGKAFYSPCSSTSSSMHKKKLPQAAQCSSHRSACAIDTSISHSEQPDHGSLRRTRRLPGLGRAQREGKRSRQWFNLDESLSAKFQLESVTRGRNLSMFPCEFITRNAIRRK